MPGFQSIPKMQYVEKSNKTNILFVFLIIYLSFYLFTYLCVGGGVGLDIP